MDERVELRKDMAFRIGFLMVVLIAGVAALWALGLF
jgi:hypothetical protein